VWGGNLAKGRNSKGREGERGREDGKKGIGIFEKKEKKMGKGGISHGGQSLLVTNSTKGGIEKG